MFPHPIDKNIQNEINIINVLKETIIVLDIEYIQGEILNVEDLYKEIKLQLSGKYINVDLGDNTTPINLIINKINWQNEINS